MNAKSKLSRNLSKLPLKIGFTILIALWILLTLDILWPIISNLSNSPVKMKVPQPGGVNYLVIAPLALGKSASAWADYRRSTGYQTQLVLLPPVQARAEEIRDLIQKRYAESGNPYPFYVLLMGHAHPFSSHPNAFLPAAHFTVDPSRTSAYGTDPIASDDVYTSFNPNGIPDHILIFWQIIRTEEEGLLLLERTKAYEESPPSGGGRARIELITSNAGFGSQYDPIFEWALRILIQKLLPNEYQWHMLNGNAKSPYSYPIYTFPNEVAKRLDSGALAMVYIGHGQPDLLGWAYSQDGEPGRIFDFTDDRLIQNANASLGIITACSAGTYDLAGDNPSVIESIILTPGGPVATYSSSAWINGTLNGRLVIDIFEALLIDKVSTVGEWVGRIESWSELTGSRILLTAVLKDIIPRISGSYQKNPLLSPTQAHQELDIQHATYTCSDPALRIAYPQPGMKVSPVWLWHPWKGNLVFHGSSDLPAGKQVSISLEILPGDVISSDSDRIGTIDRYLQANDPVIQKLVTIVGAGGKFSGRIDIPRDAPDGKYLLRAVSVQNDNTYGAANSVYIGWSSIIEIFSSTVFWWFVIGFLLLIKLVIDRHRANKPHEEGQQITKTG
jgi:hypothetical protein